VKFAVSTTSVFPSQCPLDSPNHRLMDQRWPSIGRNDATLVGHFEHNLNVAGDCMMRCRYCSCAATSIPACRVMHRSQLPKSSGCRIRSGPACSCRAFYRTTPSLWRKRGKRPFGGSLIKTSAASPGCLHHAALRSRTVCCGRPCSWRRQFLSVINWRLRTLRPLEGRADQMARARYPEIGFPTASSVVSRRPVWLALCACCANAVCAPEQTSGRSDS
jgi:hypothetical protein